MRKIDPINWDTNAYLLDTGHLTTLEHGAYVLVLMALWRSADGAIPDTDDYLARATHLPMTRWKRVAGTIRALLRPAGEGKLTQKRIRRDRKNQEVSPPPANLGRNPGANQSGGVKSLKDKETDSKSGSKLPNPATSTESTSSLFRLDSESESKTLKKTRGANLPDDWQPAESERLYARTVLKISDAQIDRAAEQMRRWARANSHRPVARKSDWAATFRNWLDREVENKPNARTQYEPRGHGPAALKIAMMENERKH